MGLFFLIVLSFLVTNQKTFAQVVAQPTMQITAQATSEQEALPRLEDLKALDYPELQVVPRASERLVMEVTQARERGLMLLFPYVASATMTLTSGLLITTQSRTDLSAASKEELLSAARVTVGVGAAGLGLAYWFSHADNFNYGSTLTQIRGLKNKDRRTELLKERLAEEAFEKSATLFSQWKWVFVATNFMASAQLTGRSTGGTNSVTYLSVAASLLPLFITTNYEENYSKQKEYKRRIYVPLTWFDYQYNPAQANWQPQLNAVWTF